MESLLLIALATFVTEDLTCIATGLLVAQGRISFLEGTLACVAGIYAGDLALFLAGRLGWKPLHRFVPAARVESASRWLSERGLSVVLLSRFTPGLRLPTYVAAGFLRTRFRDFALYLLAAAAVWTPLLVGLAALLGERAPRTILARLAAGMLLWALVRLAMNFRIRRRLIGFLKRKVCWEFWPPWAAYLPLAPYFLWLAFRHRSLTLFTAANPGIPSGGFVGESKSRILAQLGDAVAPFRLNPASASNFPVVLKPDVGERGRGVAIVRSKGEMDAYLAAAQGDVILQDYVGGMEFGIFYYRFPDEPEGRIFSITEKRFPTVTGDGRSTLEELILRDSRAVSMARAYFAASKRPVSDVPVAGESVRLVELGSHCRGAVFVDAGSLKTRALEAAVDRVSQSHPGFFFGRFDVRTPSAEDLQSGRFTVIELNGVGAEATHIYDPSVSLLEAYRVMFAQWRIAFEIGAANRELGAVPMGLVELIRLMGGRTPGEIAGAARWPRPSAKESDTNFAAMKH